MRRDELEHAIRAATQIIKDDRVIIIGSQAILGSYTEDQLPAAATMSPEVDIAPMRDTDAEALSDQLSFDAGEWSEFHAAYGFYIEGVGQADSHPAAGLGIPLSWGPHRGDQQRNRIVPGSS
ncbi:hypothetical protein ACFVYC_21365 [Pseudarthrobacter sp. NPDC058329]|uniref:hypothetical protein n=1 Tax=Pseudarthrobacter sp. NPDC058329 TaxID=3346448 RepID=UPI0036DA9A95